MKRNITTYITKLFLVVLCMFVFVGCKSETKDSNALMQSKEEDDSVDLVTTETPESEGTNDDPDQTDAGKVDDIEATKPAVDTKALVELPIYSVNDETYDVEPATALVPESSEITPELIVTSVVDNLKEDSIEIGVDAITVEGDSVVVSFKANSAPIIDLGSGMEATVLDCISNSLLDNLDSCKQVIFRKEGKEYEGGHFAFDYDEAYATK